MKGNNSKDNSPIVNWSCILVGFVFLGMLIYFAKTKMLIPYSQNDSGKLIKLSDDPFGYWFWVVGYFVLSSGFFFQGFLGIIRRLKR